MEAEKGRGEVPEDEGGVEDGPHEDGVDQDVHRVAVISAVEPKVLLKIKPSFPHFLQFRIQEQTQQSNGKSREMGFGKRE